MDDEQFKAAMESEAPTMEYIESIASEKKRKSDEENKTAHENNAKAEEEARRKAEEEAAKKLDEMQKTGKFPADDFFNSVFTVPDDEPKDKSDSSDNVSDGKKDDNDSNNNSEFPF